MLVLLVSAALSVTTCSESNTDLSYLTVDTVFCQDFIRINQQNGLWVHHWHTSKLADEIMSVDRHKVYMRGVLTAFFSRLDALSAFPTEARCVVLLLDL